MAFGKSKIAYARMYVRACIFIMIFLLFECFVFVRGWFWCRVVMGFLILRLWVRSLLARLTVFFVWCVVIGLTLFVYDLIDFVFVIDFWLIHTSDRKIIKETTLFAYVKKIIIMNLSCTSILVININILIIN